MTAFRWLYLLPLAVTAVSSEAAQITIDIRIENGRVPQSQRVIRVKQGDEVQLRWSSDRPLSLHLHGYEIETRVTPGAAAAMSFTARATGRFPIHVHAEGSSHLHDEQPLVRIEVYPR